MTNPESFCIAPWAEVRINPGGSMNFCHAADSTMIPVNDNIGTMTVEQYFGQSESVTQTRLNLETGRSIERCHRCYKDEQSGLISFRQRRNLQAAVFPGQDFSPSLAEAWPRISSWQQPRFYHISLSNLCNMACLMCCPEYSSLLTSTQQRAGVLDIKTPVLRDWTQDDRVWDGFVQHLIGNRDIVSVHIMGGEPMLHKRFLQLLDTLIQNDHCDFALTVVSNGSIYNSGIVAKLKKFRSVAIEISIESLDCSNDYIRYPGKYLDIQKNITQYLDHRDSGFDVVLRSVPQLLSAPRYDGLLQFALDNGVMVDSNFLHQPSFLALNLLPNTLKQDVIQRLSRFVQDEALIINDLNLRDSTNLGRSLSLHARQVITQINIPCVDREDKWQALIRHCRTMDRVRKLDAGLMIPDLAECFRQEGYYD